MKKPIFTEISTEMVFKNKDDLDKVIKHYVNEYQLDFDAVIPMPEELEYTLINSMDSDITKITYALNKEKPILNIEHAFELLHQKDPNIHRNPNYRSIINNNTIKFSENHEVGDDLLYNIVKASRDRNRIKNDRQSLTKTYYTYEEYDEICDDVLHALTHYNCRNWEEWRKANWNNISNASTTCITSENGKHSICITTEKSFPTPVISKIAKDLNIDMFVRFATQYVTKYSGEMIIDKNGDMIAKYKPTTPLENAKVYIAITDEEQQTQRYDVNTNQIFSFSDIITHNVQKIDTKSKLLESFYKQHTMTPSPVFRTTIKSNVIKKPNKCDGFELH